jgi:hypothetical protein
MPFAFAGLNRARLVALWQVCEFNSSQEGPAIGGSKRGVKLSTLKGLAFEEDDPFRATYSLWAV